MQITRDFIKDCSQILGRFDDVRIEKLVTLYQHQSSGSQLNLLSSEVREKFEHLLSIQRTEQTNYDTPLTRIELAVLNDFKQKYLAEPIINPEKQQTKTNTHLCLNDEITSAYCYLFAQIGDRMSKSNLDGLKFMLNIRMSVSPDNLFDIYQASRDDEIVNFFNQIYTCGYFQERNVIIIELIVSFQPFIKRYKEFLILFQKHYQSSSENGAQYSQLDAIISNENNQRTPPPPPPPQISPVKTENRLSIERTSQVVATIVPSPAAAASRPEKQSTSPSATTVAKPKRKGVCVIINIMAFSVNGSIQQNKRAGSEKDVDLIRSAFCELNFTVLQCGFDFKETHIKQALEEIDNPKIYGDYDCLVMFIMSHGYLHSFFTADEKPIAIRDIVNRFSDSSPTTIWKGKTRMFFIQACRSPWPNQQQPKGLQGVKLNDLSPKMLVAFSCSEEEASKRLPKTGSIFIQILCIMILRYGHCYRLQNILKLTHTFVVSYDELCEECQGKATNPQRPEYLEHKFDENFRFSTKCAYDNCDQWAKDTRYNMILSDRIWNGLYDRVFKSKPVNRN